MPKKYRGFMTAVGIGIFLIFSASSNAEESGEDNHHKKYTLTLGVEGNYETNPYKGVDDELMAFPYLSLHYKRLTVEGENVTFRLLEWRDLTLSALGRYRFDGYEENDSHFLRGMEEREGTFEAGLGLGYELLFGDLEVEAYSDVAGEHKGQEIGLSYELEFEVGRLSIEPRIGITWLSKKLANYYYGVKEAEARPWRTAYRPGAALNYEAGIGFSYSLTSHWMLMAGLEYERLGRDLNDSPIVEEDNLFSVLAGLSYTF